MMMKSKVAILALAVLWGTVTAAQKTKNNAPLPGNGLKQHPFLYVGEWDTRHPEAQTIFLVRDGKVVWKYSIPMHTPEGKIQEFDDATLLSNGNIVFACMSGAGIITPEQKLIWEFKCPEKTECHSCQPIGDGKVLLALNGNPAKVLVINTVSNKTLKEVTIPTATTDTHVQYRHVRITSKGTIIVPQMAENKVVEYTMEGKEVWSVPAESPWSAIRLKNGNTLISSNKCFTREVNAQGKTIWELNQDDVAFNLFNNQTANRLANGNTVICQWCAGNENTDEWTGTVQVFEVTPKKEVVWALSAWEDPDLGPATYIQLLDEPGNPDSGELQR